MITLALLKFLENEGVGKIDKDLFFQKLTLGKKGLYISDLGEAQEVGRRRSQRYEIYSRDENDVAAYQKLMLVQNLLCESYGRVCVLPDVPPIFEGEYRNVTIMPPSAIANMGLDAKGRVLYSITGLIYY